MSGFLVLHQVGERRPIAMNLANIVSFGPAVNFDHYGVATISEGAHIWTVMEAGSTNYSPWHVAETMDEIFQMLPSAFFFGKVSHD